MKRGVEANQEFYSSEIAGKINAMPPRFGAALMHAIMRADFARACACATHPAKTTAVDCLTGTGVHIQKLLDAGFSRVVGVDLSPTEIAEARARYADNSRVELVVSEIGEFLARQPGPYDLIHLGSLHHVPDYIGLVRHAAACVNRKGAIYLFEGFLRSRTGRLVARADENLYELMNSPALWFPKLWRAIGFRSKVADMWRLAGESEVHAKAGLDETAITAALRESDFEFLVHSRECLPASRLTSLLLRPLGYRTVFRLLAQRRG